MPFLLCPSLDKNQKYKDEPLYEIEHKEPTEKEQKIGKHIEELVEVGIGRSLQDRLETERDIGDFHSDEPKQDKRPRSRHDASPELIGGARQKQEWH